MGRCYSKDDHDERASALKVIKSVRHSVIMKQTKTHLSPVVTHIIQIRPSTVNANKSLAEPQMTPQSTFPMTMEPNSDPV